MTSQRRSRRLSFAALVLGLGAFVLLGPLASPASAAAPAPTLDSTFASLLNGLRSTLGIGTLSVDPELANVARAWSAHMADSGTLAHNGSLRSQVSGWAKLGENVGYGGGPTQVFNALVASPLHLRNMSDPAFTRIGVGTVTDRTGLVWTTHVFMRPSSGASAAPAPTPAPAPKPAAPAPTAAPKPAPTTAAPTTVPPTTAAPTTVPVPTTEAPAPIEAAVADEAMPAEAPAPAVDPVLASATPAPTSSVPAPLIASVALLALLVLGGGGFLLRHSSSGARTLPTYISRSKTSA